MFKNQSLKVGVYLRFDVFFWDVTWSSSGQNHVLTLFSHASLLKRSTQQENKEKTQKAKMILHFKVKFYVNRNNFSSTHFILQCHTIHMTTDKCHVTFAPNVSFIKTH